MAGAANSTMGTMVAQAASQEVNQSLINEASVATRKNAMAEAIADVIPDWIIAKRKCA
jgi:ABC-type Fe3+-citrate transport system substrate-binding protein